MRRLLLTSAILALCSAGFAFGLLGAKVYGDYQLKKLRCENLHHGGFAAYGYFEAGRQYEVRCLVDGDGRFLTSKVIEIK